VARLAEIRKHLDHLREVRPRVRSTEIVGALEIEE